jgi:uncharacterized protein (TIGR03083 family)
MFVLERGIAERRRGRLSGMSTVRQYYGDEQVPMSIAATAEEVSSAWRSHRARLRGWLRDLTEAGWSGPTRCDEWNVTDLVQHLISGSQFLGYTLHEARKGEATRLLAGFDPQGTPAAAAKMFAGMGPRELLTALDEVDRSVDRELNAFAGDSWNALAEAPLGQVPAYVSLNHFVFDSWVHERDLMLPVGQVPFLDDNEAATVAGYVVALAAVVRADGDAPRPQTTLHIRLTDIGRQLALTAIDGVAAVTFSDYQDEVDVTGTTDDVVHLATGRPVSPELTVDAEAGELLTHLAAAMA